MAYSAADTIVAIATPQGRGAIGIVRLSGPDAQRIALVLLRRDRPLKPRFATLGTVYAGVERDTVVATLFLAPASYTGEDVVEISAHGSGVVLRAIVAAAVDGGARIAEPGEFTLRAFLNGRIDLPQAEAVADLIESVTPRQARAAFDQLNGTLTQTIAALDADLFDLAARLEASVDFPDEGYHFIDPSEVARGVDAIVDRVDALLSSARSGRLVREGAQVAIVGRPNVGKSTLFNALVGSHRAIVTDVPGTTRDLVTEVVDLQGIRVTLIDTAGLRPSEEQVEAEGIRRARQAAAVADLVLVVCDGSRPLEQSDTDILSEVTDSKRVVVLNKVDEGRAWTRDDVVAVSAATGHGLNNLIEAVHAALGVGAASDSPAVTNVRHATLLLRARAALVSARDAAAGPGGGLPEEFVLEDLRHAREALEEVTGRRTSSDVLNHIFQHFCIGK
ncbi:MAG: tRNA uridine-5-carboxymethylaminomethyl(34) synthesis GTPase MnmE [Vicinamibacterales bacterium]